MAGDGTINISTRALRRAVTIAAAIVVVGALLVVAWQQRDRFDVSGILTRGLGDQIDKTTYQAVFLVGGQVYFGKLATHGDDYVVLDDVYYLSEATATGSSGAPQGELVKRGNELHGPREPMIIPVKQVLFIENLKADSKVVTAITRFRSGAPGSTTSPSTPAPVPTASATPTPTR